MPSPLAAQHDWLRSILRNDGLERFEQPILQLAQPCVRFKTRRADVPVGNSKIGGAPDLPKQLDWPTNPSRLTFLAQIDLAEINRLLPSHLPQDGLLLFFFDRHELHEGEKACRVLYANGELTRRRLPREHEVIHECALDFTAGISIPSFRYESPFVDLLGPVSENESLDLSLLDLRKHLGPLVPSHQLLGYPTGHQRDVLVQRGMHDGRFHSLSKADQHTEARRYRQLLELDTDDNADLRWVDMGTCWFLMTDDDLEHRQFSRTTSVVQFY